MSEANRRAAIGLPPAPGMDPGESRRRAILALWAFAGGATPVPPTADRSRARRAWTTGLLASRHRPGKAL